MTDRALISRVGDLQARVDFLTRAQTASDQAELRAAQARAESVAAHFGQSAPPPAFGEGALQYRRRLLKSFQQHSHQLRDTRFDSLDAGALSLMECKIYSDAVQAAKNHTGPGQLLEVRERDSAGREITKHYGDIAAFMAPFTRPGVTVKLNRNPGGTT